MRSRNHRGIAYIYLMVAILSLMGLVSLAVDYGRVQLAKTEVHAAADAAVRAAASCLAAGGTDQEVRDEASTWAQYNKVDGGQDVTLVNNAQEQDVEIGYWDTTQNPPAFVPSSTNRTAVRITVRRSAARNNAVNLIFGGFVGRPTCDVSASAVATFEVDGFAMIGLDFITMNGNASSSYWSTGTGGNGKYGSIASNGDITLGGSTDINGNARPGVGKQVFGADKVTGSTAPLSAPLVYPPGDAGSYATTNDNASLPNGAFNSNNFTVGKNKTVNLPGGHYYVNNFSTGAGSTVNFTGAATVYVYGTLDVGGNAVTLGNLPQNLNIVMVSRNGNPPGSASFGGTGALYATLYAPESDLVFSGTGDVYGSVLGKSISMIGTSNVHYDLALEGSNGLIATVQ